MWYCNRYYAGTIIVLAILLRVTSTLHNMVLVPIREEIFMGHTATPSPIDRPEDGSTSTATTAPVNDPDATANFSTQTPTAPKPKNNNNSDSDSDSEHRNRHKGLRRIHKRSSYHMVHATSPTHANITARNVTTMIYHVSPLPPPPHEEEEYADIGPPSTTDEAFQKNKDEPTTAEDNSNKSVRKRKRTTKTKHGRIIRRGDPRHKVYGSLTRRTGPPKPTRSPTPSPTQAPTPMPDPLALSCCLHSVSVDDLMRQYPPEYFSRDFFANDQNKTHKNWNAVLPHKIDGGTCSDYWRRLTLQETRGGHYFGVVLKELLGNENTTIFPYFEEARHGESEIPRALFLGDSVSRGTWERLLSLYSHRGIHLAGAPANCYGFEQYIYHDSLLHWLGPCKWDFVQFNIGLHFHPKPEGDWREEYEQGLREIVQLIHEHSPSAKIVIALTTPSPLDTEATYPLDDGSCPHLAKFHKTGFISSMNDVVKSMLGGNETIPGLWGFNDRYSLLTPHLIDYQLPCDVHYTPMGYELLAEQDWKTLVTALNMATIASRFW